MLNAKLFIIVLILKNMKIKIGLIVKNKNKILIKNNRHKNNNHVKHFLIIIMKKGFKRVFVKKEIYNKIKKNLIKLIINNKQIIINFNYSKIFVRKIKIAINNILIEKII
jgi:hypothetical protein